MSGWIKLHRKLKDWEWYDDHNCTRLLVHLLVSVNYENKRWKGGVIEAGSLATSWAKLGSETGLSMQKIRSSMQKLVQCGEVTRKITGSYQLITLVKWDSLQSGEDENNKEDNSKITAKKQKNNSKITTTKEIKNRRNKEIVYRRFTAFWNEWPNKKNKKEAEKAWAKLSDDQIEDLASNWKRFKTGYIADLQRRGDKWSLHASTFLNNQRWLDEFAEKDTKLKVVAI